MPKEIASLWWRLTMAIGLTLIFYGLALGLAGALLYIPYAEFSNDRVAYSKLTIFCLLIAGGILWAVFPRIDRFKAPGPILQPEQHPHLFQELNDIANTLGQTMPVEVYLIPELNAWVSNRGGVMGLGSRRVMGLGLPMLQALAISELRAVIVHEFGHYQGGDTALTPWVYKTGTSIVRTIDQLGGGVFSKPFIWYAKMFFHLTNKIIRRQEYAADALAAEIVGSGPMISGLKKLFTAGVAFESYWGSEVEPLLSHGFRPPLAEGFGHFLKVPEVYRAMQEALIQELEQDQGNTFDTHPSLKDRISALEKQPEQVRPQEDQPALIMIENVARLERELLVQIIGEEEAEKFQKISWEDTAVQVYLPVWKEKVRDQAQSLAGLQLGKLPDLIKSPEDFLNKLYGSAEISYEKQHNTASLLLGAAVATALYEQGCLLTKKLGEQFKVLLAGEWIMPFYLMADFYIGTISEKHWQDLCSRAGLFELDLGILKADNES